MTSRSVVGPAVVPSVEVCVVVVAAVSVPLSVLSSSLGQPARSRINNGRRALWLWSTKRSYHPSPDVPAPLDFHPFSSYGGDRRCCSIQAVSASARSESAASDAPI